MTTKAQKNYKRKLRHEEGFKHKCHGHGDDGTCQYCVLCFPAKPQVILDVEALVEREFANAK